MKNSIIFWKGKVIYEKSIRTLVRKIELRQRVHE